LRVRLKKEHTKLDRFKMTGCML